MSTYLVVVEADDGTWISEPEEVEGGRRDALEVAARKASGTVPKYNVATYELWEVDRREGEQVE